MWKKKEKEWKKKIAGRKMKKKEEAKWKNGEKNEDNDDDCLGRG